MFDGCSCKDLQSIIYNTPCMSLCTCRSGGLLRRRALPGLQLELYSLELGEFCCSSCFSSTFATLSTIVSFQQLLQQRHLNLLFQSAQLVQRHMETGMIFLTCSKLVSTELCNPCSRDLTPEIPAPNLLNWSSVTWRRVCCWKHLSRFPVVILYLMRWILRYINIIPNRSCRGTRVKRQSIWC